jgi:hypothetical protein
MKPLGRIARLIIESADGANYFEPIFIAHWNKATPFAPKEAG